MKNGQLLAQPLFWVFALVVGGLVLVFGLSLVFDLGERANYIQLLNAQEEIEKNIESWSHYDPGSSKTFQVTFPSDIDWVCFSDGSGDTDCKLGNGNDCATLVIGDDLEDLVFFAERAAQGGGENLFLLPSYAYDLTKFYVGPVKPIDSSLVCFENGDQYRLESMGAYVQIS